MTWTQKTVRRDIRCAGIGLHCGARVEMRMRPAPPDTGILFRRLDRDGAEIPAAQRFLSRSNLATTLSMDGASIRTVEHILAAASGLGIDNLIVEVEGQEVPILDGSAAPFIYLMHEAGVRQQQAPRQFIKILEPIRFEEDGKFVAVYPADRFKISYTIVFDHPLIGEQRQTFVVTPRCFTEQIAPARTFGFLREVEQLRKNGFALGGSMENAVVVGDTSILNNQLRFQDEFVRHKILDAIGDLMLLGAPLLGHVVAYRAGHSLHASLVEAILSCPEAWRRVTWEDVVYDIASRRPYLVPARA
ncbi:MAG: UDP-3-O-acyl-N-acetylglucosamine deacetylase [Acidobacteriota bacterium]